MFVVPDEVPNTEDEGPLVSSDADMMAIKGADTPSTIRPTTKVSLNCAMILLSHEET